VSPVLITVIIIGGIIVVIMLIVFGFVVGLLSEIRRKEDRINTKNREHEEQMRQYYERRE